MMSNSPNKPKLHPDEVFKGIMEYVQSVGYQISVDSNIELLCFDSDLLETYRIEPPVYSYGGRKLHDPDEEKTNG